MAALTVRNVDEETRAGLKELGAQHGRSMESEARVILADAVRQHRRSNTSGGLGSRIHEMFADLEWQGVDRASEEARGASFETS